LDVEISRGKIVGEHQIELIESCEAWREPGKQDVAALSEDGSVEGIFRVGERICGSGYAVWHIDGDRAESRRVEDNHVAR